MAQSQIVTKSLIVPDDFDISMNLGVLQDLTEQMFTVTVPEWR